MKPLSRQLALPFRAPPDAAPRALSRPAAAGRLLDTPQRAPQAAPDLSVRLARAVLSMETPA